MIWLTWRQHRFESLIALAFFGLFAAFLVPTGVHLASVYRRLGVGSCLGQSAAPTCTNTLNAFWGAAGVTNWVGWANFLPLIFGVLLAAPFVLDLETGTYRLAWTQSITRTRWMLTKISLLTVGCILTGAALSILMSWWRIPLDHLEGSFSPNDAFNFEGIVPIAYILFSVALVLTLGTLLRRIVPAIGISLVVFLTVRLGIQNFLRPHYLIPVTTLTPASADAKALPFSGTNWILDTGLSDAHGRRLADNAIFQICGSVMRGTSKGTGGQRDALAACLQNHHIFNYVTYQPAGRFWAFQGIETGIYLGISAMLLAVAVWWIRYRIT